MMIELMMETITTRFVRAKPRFARKVLILVHTGASERSKNGGKEFLPPNGQMSPPTARKVSRG